MSPSVRSWLSCAVLGALLTLAASGAFLASAFAATFANSDTSTTESNRVVQTDDGDGSPVDPRSLQGKPLPNSPTHSGVPAWHDAIKPNSKGILPTTPPYAQDYLDSESPQEKAAIQAKDQLLGSLSGLRHADGTPKVFGAGLSQDKQGNWIIMVIPDDYPTLPEVKNAIPPSVNGVKVWISNFKRPTVKPRSDAMKVQ
jgi:hypothetical protein